MNGNWTYAYDASGSRVRKTVAGASVNPINAVDPTGHVPGCFMMANGTGPVAWASSCIFGDTQYVFSSGSPAVVSGGLGGVVTGDPFDAANNNLLADEQQHLGNVAETIALDAINKHVDEINQQLSDKSKTAINQAFGKGSAGALLWAYEFLRAGAESAVDANILVGLGARESGLDPNEVNGQAQGMFQILPPRQEDLGLSDHDLFNPNVVVGAVAGALASATKTFTGNTDLAIASWTLGVGHTGAAFRAGGMEGVRNLLLDKKHPGYGRVGSYIDFVNGFKSP